MTVQELAQKKVAVLGFGMEGQAITRWLLSHQITPIIFDEKPMAEWAEEDARFAISNELSVTSGPSYMEGLDSFEVIFRSPGIRRLHPLLLEAEKNGTLVTSQACWFLENCPATIIGVTGTKGKGTTSALIYEVVKNALTTKAYKADSILKPDSRVFLTGNIGKTQPFEILDTLTKQDIIVYELSSFQLQDAAKSPQFAVVLMVTQDHLDHHQSVKEYHEAKHNIVAHQTEKDFAIINADYPASAEFSKLTPANVIWISQRKKPDIGAYISGEDEVEIFGLTDDLPKPFVALDELVLRGKHNLQNVSAASLVTLEMGIKPQTIIDNLVKFPGLEHRLQLVGKANGVSYYDDSFSTVPETTIAAIEAFDEPTILIFGGSEKHSDFTELAQKIIAQQNIKALIIIGQTTDRITDALKKAGGFNGNVFTDARTMDQIFEQIGQVTESGDVVVLSPACASFDMFENYRERGNQFAQRAEALERKTL